MDKCYHSVYGLHIKQFIQTKRKLGFKYVTETFALSKIDDLATQTRQTSQGITKAFADMWAEKRPNESRGYHYHRMLMLVQLSSYINDIGIESYIPKLPRFPENTFIPYVYSRDEIAMLFKACDELRMQIAHRESCLFCMPVLLRLLYATGIRIGEALDLKDEDVNLEDGYIRIQDSKNKKQRAIPISASLNLVCKEYLSYRAWLPYKNSTTGFFFVNVSGNKCGQGFRKWFRKCLEHANIPYLGEKHGPRIHDLRHTFAVNSLAGMAEAGIDLYASLPILSNYLGHQSIGATDHYVRLTASMFPDLIRDMDKTCIDVFPKFRNYGAD
ncbi:tyrosine-type recombinase/integrase [Echinicola vietnamensis]|uniref:Site-specific recombinase XerD n=1 Tax=Echinicola vietnamensis (strain DSM 17526 / LMG 23754 / KMM 6221) TaxID=926556 RepID=L0FUH3_ECHVK|nr:tyrosine-type recombinase/integrase [Echinicola vietnamensis]AGA76330.1 site-specific recombinase XerD [Echinicola vietnamensis DSM 17526]AGA78794.1 site-specific recombinase XerD [Echinicola vietnamensis DSM 17526]AGA80534.1 site-specific recombinase XerD [Echinicola vietnamensis DSM 17526]